MIVAEVKALYKDYRSGLLRRLRALENVSVAVAEGSITALLGPNGAGKTTTIHTLLGFLRPSSGTARLFGAPAGCPELLRKVGYLPEDYQAHLFDTPVTALRYLGGLSGLTAADLRDRIPAVLGRVGLAPHASRSVRSFSKGMVQRLGLAQAVLHQPRLLILDEPMTGLDPEGRHDTGQLLLEERARGTTVILCSHILQDVERVADYAYIYRQGRVIGSGAMRDLIGVGRDLEAAYLALQKREGCDA